jgi:modulator of FtsH protease HflK
LYIDAMQEIYTNVTKVIVDSKGNSQLLYLPLDKLIEKTGSSGAESSATSAAAAAKAAETSPSAPRAANDGFDTSIRDAMRNRDRGAR